MGQGASRVFRVLVIDDDALFARATARLLQKLGHEAMVAMTTSEGLATLFATPFDMVITDYDLREPMTGDQLLDLIGARWPRVYRVLCSGQVRTAAAAQSILQKPITPDDLVRMLDAAMGT